MTAPNEDESAPLTREEVIETLVALQREILAVLACRKYLIAKILHGEYLAQFERNPPCAQRRRDAMT